MAKQRLMQDLRKATVDLVQHVKRAEDSVKADPRNVQKIDAAVADLKKYGKTLDTCYRAAANHIESWGKESRWKRAKNVAIPQLTAGRKQLQTMTKTVSLTLYETGLLVERYGRIREAAAKEARLRR